MGEPRAGVKSMLCCYSYIMTLIKVSCMSSQWPHSYNVYDALFASGTLSGILTLFSKRRVQGKTLNMY